jgi:hypothetical protein
LRVSNPARLSLGALFRQMRAGLGDAGGARVTLEFRQHTAEASADAGLAASAGLHLRALVDDAEGELQRAEVNLEASAALDRHLEFRHNGGAGYAYSIDGGRGWGRFLGTPRIFHLGDFEAALDEVAVDDVIVEAVPQERWWDGDSAQASAGAPAAVQVLPAQVLEVTMDRAAFGRLLHIFAADIDDEPANLTLAGFSVSITAAEDVSLLCWWSLRGVDQVPAAIPELGDPTALQITCSVALSVAPLEPPACAEAVVDDSLPLVGRVDEVWELLRRP